MIGHIIAEKYEIVEKIGEGGTAEIYKARDNVLKRYAAVKILKKEFLRDEMETYEPSFQLVYVYNGLPKKESKKIKDNKFIKKFEEESKILNLLNHENIVDLYEFYIENDEQYIIMELVEGESIYEKIKRAECLLNNGWNSLYKVLLCILDGLKHIHDKGIIHRDIKPKNILISKEGRLKIVDFGIAKSLDEYEEIDFDNSIIGSVHYMSPEQLNGEELDYRSDIYSLGITLYEIITGEKPFCGDEIEVYNKHMIETPAKPSNVKNNCKILRELDDIIMKMINKDPVDRFQKVQEIIDEIDKIRIDCLADKKNKDVDLNEKENYILWNKLIKEDLVDKTILYHLKDIIINLPNIQNTFDISPESLIDTFKDIVLELFEFVDKKWFNLNGIYSLNTVSGKSFFYKYKFENICIYNTYKEIDNRRNNIFIDTSNAEEMVSFRENNKTYINQIVKKGNKLIGYIGIESYGDVNLNYDNESVLKSIGIILAEYLYSLLKVVGVEKVCDFKKYN